MTKPLPMDGQKKSVIWREWERGTPMANIAHVINKLPATVFSYLQYHGGIRPRHRFRNTKKLMVIFTENQPGGGSDKNLDCFHGIRPRLLRYSIGLLPPRDMLMRFSLYQRM